MTSTIELLKKLLDDLSIPNMPVHEGDEAGALHNKDVEKFFNHLKAYDSIHDFREQQSDENRVTSQGLNLVFKNNVAKLLPDIEETDDFNGYKDYLSRTLGTEVLGNTITTIGVDNCTNIPVKGRYESRVNILYDNCRLDNQTPTYTWDQIVSPAFNIDDLPDGTDLIIVKNSTIDTNKTYKKLIYHDYKDMNITLDEATKTEKIENRKNAGRFILQFLFSIDDPTEINEQSYYLTFDANASKTTMCLSEFTNVYSLLTPQNVSDSATTSRTPFLNKNLTDLGPTVHTNTEYSHYSPKTDESGTFYEYTSLLWSKDFFNLYLMDSSGGYSKNNISGFKFKITIKNFIPDLGVDVDNFIYMDYSPIHFQRKTSGPSAPYIAKLVNELHQILRTDSIISVLTKDSLKSRIEIITSIPNGMFNLTDTIVELFNKLDYIERIKNIPVVNQINKKKEKIVIIISLLIDIKRTGDYEQANVAKYMHHYNKLSDNVSDNVIFSTGDLLCFTYASRILNTPCILEGQDITRDTLILYRGKKKNISNINIIHNILINVRTALNNILGDDKKQIILNIVKKTDTLIVDLSSNINTVKGEVVLSSSFDKLIYNLSTVRFQQIIQKLKEENINIKTNFYIRDDYELEDDGENLFTRVQTIISELDEIDKMVEGENKKDKANTYVTNDSTDNLIFIETFTTLLKKIINNSNLINKFYTIDETLFKEHLKNLFRSNIIDEPIHESVIEYLTLIDYNYDEIKKAAISIKYFLDSAEGKNNRIVKNIKTIKNSIEHKNKLKGIIEKFLTCDVKGIQIINNFLNGGNYLNEILSKVDDLKSKVFNINNFSLDHYLYTLGFPTTQPITKTESIFKKNIEILSDISPETDTSVSLPATASGLPATAIGLPATAHGTPVTVGYGGTKKRKIETPVVKLEEDDQDELLRLELKKKIPRIQPKVEEIREQRRRMFRLNKNKIFAVVPPPVNSSQKAYFIDIYDIFTNYIYIIHNFINDIYTDYSTKNNVDAFINLNYLYEIHDVFNTYFNKTKKITKIEKGKKNYITEFGYPKPKNFNLRLKNLKNFPNFVNKPFFNVKILRYIENVFFEMQQPDPKFNIDDAKKFIYKVKQDINIYSNILSSSYSTVNFKSYLDSKKDIITDFFNTIMDDFMYDIYYYKLTNNIKYDLLDKFFNLFYSFYDRSEEIYESVDGSMEIDHIKMFKILKNLASYKNIIEMNYKPFNKHLMPNKDLFLNSLQLQVEEFDGLYKYFKMKFGGVNYKLIDYKINVFRKLILDLTTNIPNILSSTEYRFYDDNRYDENWTSPCYITLPKNILDQSGIGKLLQSEESDINNYYVLIHKPRNGEYVVQANYHNQDTITEWNLLYQKKAQVVDAEAAAGVSTGLPVGPLTLMQPDTTWQTSQQSLGSPRSVFELPQSAFASPQATHKGWPSPQSLGSTQPVFASRQGVYDAYGGKKTKKNKRKKYKSIRKKKRYKNTKKRRKKSIKNKKSKRKSIKYKK